MEGPSVQVNSNEPMDVQIRRLDVLRYWEIPVLQETAGFFVIKLFSAVFSGGALTLIGNTR